MKWIIAVAFIVAGLAIGIVGLTVLPAGHGRYEYLIQVADPRPSVDAEASAELNELGAIRAVVAEGVEAGSPRTLLLLESVPAALEQSDCALGHLPEAGGPAALAGFDSGVNRGAVTIAGREMTVCGVLQALGPLFDQSLVVQHAEALESDLRRAGWQLETRYLLFPSTWDRQQQVVHRLRTSVGLVPAEGDITTAGSPPLLSPTARTALAAVLIVFGLGLLVWQVRGMSREDFTRRFIREE